MERLKKLIPDYKFVKTAQSCERRNRLVQQNMFRILKNRQATSVKDAVRKSMNMINDTYNKIQKKTPNEVVDEQKHEETIKNSIQSAQHLSGAISESNSRSDSM